MGLDLVEYIMAVEDAFEISIPDADAAYIESPRQLIDYLSSRLGESPDGPPLVQTVFYRLRVAIVEEIGVARREIHPATQLASLAPHREENEVWAGVAQRLNLHAKDLTHAPVLKWLAKLRQAPPRSIGEVASQMAMLHPAALRPRPARWTRAQITEVVTRLLEHEIALDIKPFGLDATFVRDLGMG